jgi:hypothetical protein
MKEKIYLNIWESTLVEMKGKKISFTIQHGEGR